MRDAGILPPGGFVSETSADDMALYALEVISHASNDSVGSRILVVRVPHLKLPAGRHHRALGFIVHIPASDTSLVPKVGAVIIPEGGRRHSCEATASIVPVDVSRGPVVHIANEPFLVPVLFKHGASHLLESIIGSVYLQC